MRKINIIFLKIFMLYLCIFLCSDRHIFSMSLATVHLHFVLDFAHLLHISLNHLTILSSHRRGGLQCGHFRSLGYHLVTLCVHLLAMNLATGPARWNFYPRYSTITSFTPLTSRITSLRMCLFNGTPNMDIFISLCAISSFYSSFLVAYVSFVHNIVV